MSAWCIVVAAGKGTRSGLHENKIFFSIDGKPMLLMTLDALTASDAFDGIVLVIAPEDEKKVRGMLPLQERALPLRIAYGGSTRQASVMSGIQAVPSDTEIIAVHDAARPFVTSEIIHAVLDSAGDHGSGVIATQVTDTIKQIDPDGRISTVDRNTLRSVQTPQAFRADLLREYHARAVEDGFIATDDAMLFEHYEGNVSLVETKGANLNKKMTTPEDFVAMDRTEMRVGTGYDVHRLKEGRDLILCGVKVPHDRGLDGHSDADVAVHALMDALLGAAGLGDIGLHFPDTDPAYKGISSMKLLNHVMLLLSENGWHVLNADLTIVAQRPKLRPYIEEMRQNLQEALRTQTVNVKATTTERLGFEGEEKGISAQAIAMIGALR